MKSTACILSVLLFSYGSFANDRIENITLNRKSVTKKYISFGRTQVLRFPEAIEEIRLGLPNFYNAEISKKNNKELAIHLKEDINLPTNLIVRTSVSNIYVFDLVPSKSQGKDFTFIESSFYPVPENQITESTRKVLTAKPKELLFYNQGRKGTLR